MQVIVMYLNRVTFILLSSFRGGFIHKVRVIFIWFISGVIS